jgi:hypothetical protein
MLKNLSQDLCNNPATMNITAQQCPFTCKACPTGSSTVSGLLTTTIAGQGKSLTTTVVELEICIKELFQEDYLGSGGANQYFRLRHDFYCKSFTIVHLIAIR